MSRITELPFEQMLLDGLCTDGAHHKQWYLQELLKELVDPERREQLIAQLRSDGYEFEDGIAP